MAKVGLIANSQSASVGGYAKGDRMARAEGGWGTL